VSGLLQRRHRVLRVRHVQHALAAADAMRAQEEADGIARNAERVRNVRAGLFGSEGVATGASFAAYRELAQRLEQAGRQLDGALYDARRKVDEKKGRRIEANREREIAERLRDRTRAALDAEAEAKVAALPRYRKMQMREGDS
jgi:flagellar biosynthesis chaperone FliJ